MGLIAIANSFWVGPVIWALLYYSDYLLTILCARLYRANDKMAVEGSYEITPYYQKDVDALRLWSPRFVAALVWGWAFLALIWWLAQRVEEPQLYFFALGAYVLPELAVHKRHLQNLAFFRALKTEAIKGRIEYSRPFILRQSSLELFCFAGLFLVLFLVTQSWFIVGGFVACLFTALQHLRQARTFARNASLAASGQP